MNQKARGRARSPAQAIGSAAQCSVRALMESHLCEAHLDVLVGILQENYHVAAKLRKPVGVVADEPLPQDLGSETSRNECRSMRQSNGRVCPIRFRGRLPTSGAPDDATTSPR